jgi:hypothetical protein
MRGPLESLIAQARQEQIRKALPPSLFAKADRTLHHAAWVPVAQLWHETSASRQLLPGKAFVNDCKLPSYLWLFEMPLQPLSDRIAPYLFGYCYSLRLGVNFGPICDMKSAR